MGSGPREDLWRGACAWGCASRRGETGDAGSIVNEPEHSGAPQPRRPFGLPLGRAPSMLALLPVLPGTGLSRRLESIAAQGATRREPSGGQTPGAKASDGRCGAIG